MSISELKPGQRARVDQVTGNGAIRQRLLEMGLMPEAQLQVERVAPSGDPIWIKLHGYLAYSVAHCRPYCRWRHRGVIADVTLRWPCDAIDPGRLSTGWTLVVH